MRAADSASVRLYISSSSSDRQLQKELCEALTPWAEPRGVRIWHSGLLQAGMRRSIATDELSSAHIVVLVLSASLFSDSWTSEELELALARHMRGEAWVIPVLIRPFLWRNTPVQSLAVLPSDQRAVISWPNRDEAWLDVVTGIASVADMLEQRPMAPAAAGAGEAPEEALRAEKVAERLSGSMGEASAAGGRSAFEWEAWLFDRCAKGEHAELRKRASECADPGAAARLFEMANDVQAGRWPAAVAPALLQLQRTSAGWRADVRLGFLGQVCSLSLRPGARAPLGMGASLESVEEDGETILRLAARAESALRGTRARVQAGVRAFTKWLVPSGTGALGGAESQETTLLELTLSTTEEEP